MKKGITRLSVGYCLMFLQLLFVFDHKGAKNVFRVFAPKLSVQTSPVLWYIGLFLVGAVGLALAIWGWIDYRKAFPTKAAPTLAKGSNDPYRDEKGREYFFDNAKFILIFLVVVAHLASPHKSIKGNTMNDQYMLLWRVINTLHMPGLIFISGYFAKKYIRPDGSINVQRPFTYIVFYLVCQVTVAMFERRVLGDNIVTSALSPRSSLWFLVCLIWWYMLLPVIDKIDRKTMLVVAFAVGIAVGYDEKASNLMANCRMITHFPFFLLGYYLTGDKMQFLHTKKAKMLSIPIFVLAILTQMVFFYLCKPSADHYFNINSVITCDRSYLSVFKDSGIRPALWCLARIWFYACALALIFVFLTWVPKKKNIFTKFGARTMAPYIMHRYLYLAYLEFKWYDFAWLGITVKPEIAGLLAIAAAAVVTIIFSLRAFYLPFELLSKISVKKWMRTAEK